MIEIAKGLIDMIIKSFNIIFDMPITIKNGVAIKFGYIAIGFLLFGVMLYFLFKALGIDIGGEDD